MLERWTGKIVGEMHIHKISTAELAEKMGVSRQYVHMILNMDRTPADGRERMEAALAALIEEKKKGA